MKNSPAHHNRAVIHPGLADDVRRLIDDTRTRVAATVNAELTMLYWQIGKRIHEEILDRERAEYGKEIVAALARHLTIDYGNGFSEKNLRHMVVFAEVFPEEEIVSALRRQLSWTHFKAIIYLDDPLKREFYAEMSRIERWSTRTLHKQIDSMLYERTAISRKPEEVIRHTLGELKTQDRMTPDLIFRDPYVLDFLGLADSYLERDLEESLLRELERFLLEFGAGFTFVARQKRMTIDNRDFSLDLLFYHRKLRRLVAVELKIGPFQAGYKGQMELYLRWLERYEMEEGEESPIGLILCTEGSREQIELLRLDESGIRVAEYMTELPPRELLERKLQSALNRICEHIQEYATTKPGD